MDNMGSAAETKGGFSKSLKTKFKRERKERIKASNARRRKSLTAR